jgi:hypothetical protein
VPNGLSVFVALGLRSGLRAAGDFAQAVAELPVARQCLDRNHDRRLSVRAEQIDVQAKQVEVQRPQNESQHLAGALMVGGSEGAKRLDRPT